MAKKRVHEIAKQRGIPSKEVIAVLQRAGLDVKTAAQSIDENDIAMAFSNGGKGPQTPQPRPQPQRVQPPTQGGARNLAAGPLPPPKPQPEQAQEGKGKQSQAEQQQRPAQAGDGARAPQRDGGGQGGRGERPSRPTRGVPPGRDSGAGGRRRRVV